MNYELIITSDGSHTLFVPEIDECYHSIHGAIQESRHIFIEAGLNHCSKSEINILEVGFGTGLNTFLAFIEAEKNGIKIRNTTLEKYPITYEKSQLLNYPAIINPSKQKKFEEMHKCAWNELIEVTDFFELKKIECDFAKFEHQSNYDVVFFDAFSPEKQPELWSEALFAKIYDSCNAGAILTTYCAKGMVRRALQNVGFRVERLPGPPGKREILRAIK